MKIKRINKYDAAKSESKAKTCKKEKKKCGDGRGKIITKSIFSALNDKTVT